MVVTRTVRHPEQLRCNPRTVYCNTMGIYRPSVHQEFASMQSIHMRSSLAVDVLSPYPRDHTPGYRGMVVFSNTDFATTNATGARSTTEKRFGRRGYPVRNIPKIRTISA